jgi:hypothetical protein
MILVNLEILSIKIVEATGLTPVSMIETSTSAANLITILSSWFINFSKNSKAKLPKQLSLFGIITNAQPLSRRTKTI